MRPKELSQQTLLEPGRPGNRYARLEIVFVVIIQRRLAVRLSRQIDRDRIVEGSARGGAGQAFCEKVRKRNVGRSLEPLVLPYGCAEAIAQPVCDCKIRHHLPD